MQNAPEFDSSVHVALSEDLRSQLEAISLGKDENLSATIRRILTDAANQHDCNVHKLRVIMSSFDELLGVLGLIHQGLIDMEGQDIPAVAPCQLATVMRMTYEELHRDCWGPLRALTREK